MAFDFPASPIVGQQYAPAGGPVYQWNGTGWVVVEAPQLFATAKSRNRIINGAMQISQENGSTGLISTGYWLADQWFGGNTTAGTAWFQRYASSTSPYGSVNKLLIQVGTVSASITGTQSLLLGQSVEGIHIADFQWGTASAKPVVLRFGVRSGVAGTFGGSILNGASNRSYVFNYTIGAGEVDTDVYRTIVIPGETTGVWPVNNTKALELWFAFAAGPTVQAAPGAWATGSFVAPTGITNGMAVTSKIFQIFDVGLYLDPDNTGLPPKWEMPDEAEELRACQRYFWRWDSSESAFNVLGIGSYLTATVFLTPVTNPVKMRGAPAVSFSAAATFAPTTTTAISTDVMTSTNLRINCVVSGGTAKQAELLSARSVTTTFMNVSARL